MADEVERGNILKDYDLQIEEISKTIKENGYTRVLLQFPEGLKRLATEVKDQIEKEAECDIIISADPCFGACDLPTALSMLHIDLLVQFGHSEIPNLQVPVPSMFIEAYSNLDVIPVLEKAVEYITGNVGLITTSQHIHKMDEVADYLMNAGFKIFIGKGSGRTPHDGQVLGCNIKSATSISNDVDCYLFLGSGNFHGIGVAMATKKPVYIADPYLSQVRETVQLKEKLLRQRFAAMEKAKEAENFGIIIGTKPGQLRLDLALELKRFAKKHHKRTYLIALNEFSPAKLIAFDIQAYVTVACPRIAVDDYMMYDVPILTSQEFKIVLGEDDWDNYRFDEIL
jgi:2-(3-amino-3-carboxypropyl)histidine synthase